MRAAMDTTPPFSTDPKNVRAPASSGGARVALRALMRKLGPGLITGAADDDPSGIATYSQGGAQFGLGLLWTLLFTYPLMVGIQMVSARIGVVTGRGLTANIRRVYPSWIVYALVGSLAVANTINIGADLAAMGDVAEIATGVPSQLYDVGIGVLCLMLQIFIPYRRYVRILKWLTLALLAYVGVLFSVHVSWGDIVFQTFVAQRFSGADYVVMTVAIFGTTISPYLFFWQAAQEVEEQRATAAAHLRRDPSQAAAHLRRIKIDTYVGMGFSNVIAFFIVLAAAATLYEHGVRNIETSVQAAQALRPIAGDFAFALFTLGIVGTGLLAVPVLAGSAAYAVAEALRWPAGLGLKPSAGKGFYAIIALSTVLGVALDFSGVAPMKALIWTAVINGVISVPLMAALMHMASQRRVMGPFAITRRLKFLGWTATAVMGIMAVALLCVVFAGMG